ncbi:helix-turn-helix transcriptional regulator [Salmonella enterica subsp. enterica]|nr:helix-turn-helix transcriptional regulator [Salmonella enterica subsp. enterica]
MAHSSPFHFHRQFTVWSGLPLYRYIQWLHVCAGRHGGWRLKSRKISYRYRAGCPDFQNPGVVHTWHKTAFGQSPRRFRQSPDWLAA